MDGYSNPILFKNWKSNATAPSEQSSLSSKFKHDSIPTTLTTFKFSSMKNRNYPRLSAGWKKQPLVVKKFDGGDGEHWFLLASFEPLEKTTEPSIN
ncbi:hypothetical protein V6N13_134015 [Hibiscus sabdariffa]|uniref:Uncharacterized protein n=1 Tax=Hibiscus sabdariffa TaxID=183260 RepID=A0ABR2QZG5_9ROSI